MLGEGERRDAQRIPDILLQRLLVLGDLAAPICNFWLVGVGPGVLPRSETHSHILLIGVHKEGVPIVKSLRALTAFRVISTV